VGHIATRLAIFEGREGVRELFQDWAGTYDDLAVALEEIHDLGNGAVFYVLRHWGGFAGGSGSVELRHSYTAVGSGLITRVIVVADIEEGRAAAERLAAERGVGGVGKER
jgi:hypothetical protein